MERVIKTKMWFGLVMEDFRIDRQPILSVIFYFHIYIRGNQTHSLLIKIPDRQMNNIQHSGSCACSLSTTSQPLPCLVQDLYISKISEIGAAKFFCLVHPLDRKIYFNYKILFKGNVLHKVTYLMSRKPLSRRITNLSQCFRAVTSNPQLLCVQQVLRLPRVTDKTRWSLWRGEAFKKGVSVLPRRDNQTAPIIETALSGLKC